MNKMMRATTAALALLATTGQALAAAKDPPCLTRQEASSLILTILPGALKQVTTACSKTLPASAYLVRSGAAMVARYDAPAKAARPEAVAALNKALAGDVKIDDSMFDLFSGTILSEMKVEKLSATQCANVSEMAEALEPLPPVNLAELFVAVFKLGLEAKAGEAPPFRICEAN
ncbi:hypothetical protein HZY97_04955 [Sphingomonas sp. R-74633]|uniref:hypothetical protein n=1 Tax=Sphingomonas sp. R-74633 TaxID=2751188 RepID=UPI0015D0D500|nr:hypothetical protein [Sphingomonas sp. R-74633]NYT40094.1 hypothetical protein [Sphingomonas sp. R-74633]